MMLVTWTCVVPLLLRWFTVVAREMLLRRYILSRQSFEMQPMSRWQWAVVVVSFPVLEPLADFIFNTCAAWRMLWHAVWSPYLKWVTSPKKFDKISLEPYQRTYCATIQGKVPFFSCAGFKEP